MSEAREKNERVPDNRSGLTLTTPSPHRSSENKPGKNSLKKESKLTRALSEFDAKLADQRSSDNPQVQQQQQHLTDEREDAIQQLLRVQLIHTTPDDRSINALVTLNGVLYVRPQHRDIAVHETESFNVRKHITLSEIGRVSDMASCSWHRCLYIGDRKLNVIHRLERRSPIPAQWDIGAEPAGLSVTSAHNLLVACIEIGLIKEFRTHGELVRDIVLQPEVEHPWHAVELDPEVGTLAVSHGRLDDPLHRVCAVDPVDGKVLASYGGPPGSGRGQLNTPVRLAVHGFLFVSDLHNKRVLMLSRTTTLRYIRPAVLGLQGPLRIWIDPISDLLYVADNSFEKNKWTSGRVNIYELSLSYSRMLQPFG